MKLEAKPGEQSEQMGKGRGECRTGQWKCSMCNVYIFALKCPYVIQYSVKKFTITFFKGWLTLKAQI